MNKYEKYLAQRRSRVLYYRGEWAYTKQEALAMTSKFTDRSRAWIQARPDYERFVYWGRTWYAVMPEECTTEP